MIYATLIHKETGTPFGRVSVMREEDLDNYRSETVDVQLGWKEQVQQLNADRIAVNQVRNIRNQILDSTAWTIREDSPLSKANQAQWFAYRKKLHGLLLDNPNLTNLQWPEEPELEYD